MRKPTPLSGTFFLAAALLGTLLTACQQLPTSNEKSAKAPEAVIRPATPAAAPAAAPVAPVAPTVPAATALGASAPSNSARPTTAFTPPTPGTPPPFAVVIREARRIDGPLTLWQKDDKVWIEIMP